MNQVAVNPQTGEAVELRDGQWVPVDKSRIAKDAAGNTAVFDGSAWKTFGGAAPPATPPAGDLPSGMPSGVPFGQLAQEPMGQPEQAFTMDDAAYLAQSPYRGLGNLAGAPVDIATMLMNAGLAGVEKTANFFGGENWIDPEPADIQIPRIERPFGGSQQLRDATADAVTSAGVKVVAPEEVGMTTRVAGNAIDLGTQAAAGGAGLANVALRKAGREGVESLGPMLQQYAKKPVGTTAVDTAAGAGAGVADQTAQEYDIDNPFVRFLLASAGGYGGARLAQTAVSPVAASQAIIDRVLPSPDIAPDTALNFSVPVSRNTEQMTAEALQSHARNPSLAARTVKEGSLEARNEGWTPPTSGQLSNDPGLLYLEKRSRLGPPSKDPKEPREGTPAFVERDRQIQDELGQSVNKLAPEDANPRIPTDAVTGQVRGQRSAYDQQRLQATQARDEALAATAEQQARLAAERETRMAGAGVKEQQAKQAIEGALDTERKLGSQVQGNLGQKGPASENLAGAVSTAKEADQQMKSGLYNRAEELATGKVDVRPYAAEVQDIKRKLQPLAATDKSVANAMPDFDSLLDEAGQGAIGTRDLIQMLPRLSAANKAAVTNMRGDVGKAIGRITDKIKGDLTARAAQGDEAALAWSGAERYFQKDFAPKYREGVGAKLDKAERSGQPVPATAQAGMFLKPRGGGKEAAADLNRVLTGASSEAAGKAAARDYVLSDLATLVKDNGTIEPNRLRAWTANHQGMLSQLPAVKAEVDKLLVDVVNRRDGTNATKKALDAAVAERKGVKLALDRREKEVLANAKLNEKQKSAEIAKIDQERGTYERDLQDNAIRHLVDADPRNAVTSIFGSRDPERAMSQIVEKFKGDKDASTGWKRAVSDWLAEQVSLKGAPDSISGLDPVSLNKISKAIEKNGPALAKVFTPGEMNTLRRVQRTLDVLSRKGIGATTGSPTAENTAAMSVMELVLKQTLGNLEGGGQMRRFKLGLSLLPGTPKGARVDRLIERAMLDPELMHHLLTVPVKESMIPTWNRQLTRLIAARNTFAEGDEK
jgi:hypothetical protein